MPLQPVAVTVIIDVPVHAAVYVTAPVDVTIVLPAVVLAASSAYTILMLLEAVAV
jgi:hypothetical protein